jgi:hypothetical protein
MNDSLRDVTSGLTVASQAAAVTTYTLSSGKSAGSQHACLMGLVCMYTAGCVQQASVVCCSASRLNLHSSIATTTTAQARASTLCTRAATHCKPLLHCKRVVAHTAVTAVLLLFMMMFMQGSLGRHEVLR